MSGLGRRVIDRDPEENYLDGDGVPDTVNTRTSLWPEKWPAIALQECIDTVESAPPEMQAQVKKNLPCADCPENSRCLNAKQIDMGPLLYGRELLTVALSSESSLFPFGVFAPMLHRRLSQVNEYRKPYGIEEHLVVVSGWDLAWSEKVGGDRLVRCTAVLDLRNNKRTLLNIKRHREGMKFSEQCQTIEDDHQLFQEDLVVLESDAAQAIWSQRLQEETSVPVMMHRAGEDKQSLRTGVPGLLADLDARRWIFPYQEDSLQLQEVKQFLAECAAFGWHDGKLQGVGEHDDTVMAWWHCWWGLRMAKGEIREFESR